MRAGQQQQIVLSSVQSVLQSVPVQSMVTTWAIFVWYAVIHAAHHCTSLVKLVTKCNIDFMVFFRFSGTQNSDFVYFLYKLLDQNQPQNNVLKYLVTIVIDCHIQGKFRINSDTFFTNWINTLMQELL